MEYTVDNHDVSSPTSWVHQRTSQGGYSPAPVRWTVASSDHRINVLCRCSYTLINSTYSRCHPPVNKIRENKKLLTNYTKPDTNGVLLEFKDLAFGNVSLPVLVSHNCLISTRLSPLNLTRNRLSSLNLTSTRLSSLNLTSTRLSSLNLTSTRLSSLNLTSTRLS